MLNIYNILKRGSINWSERRKGASGVAQVLLRQVLLSFLPPSLARMAWSPRLSWCPSYLFHIQNLREVLLHLPRVGNSGRWAALQCKGQVPQPRGHGLSS